MRFPEPLPIALLAVLFTGLSLGCAEPPMVEPPWPDTGPPPDAIDPLADTDGDGLCDSTEVNRLTDPLNVDTDGDGYSDFVEAVYGFNPRQPSSPDRDFVLQLTESPASAVQVTSMFSVRGMGEDYVGFFETRVAYDLLDLTALDFHSASIALFANPQANVAIMDELGAQFRGVVGRTQLAFETRLAYATHTDQHCVRAYPFRYRVKRSDGAVIGLRNYLLVVVPVGGRVTGDAWCTQLGRCL